MPKESKVEIVTILSNRTKEGMINFFLEVDGTRLQTQWDVSKAKHIVAMLHEAIEAAISDELIYKFMTTKVGLDDKKASMALLDFRELRQGSFEAIDPH
jgi:hypothetical protein